MKFNLIALGAIALCALQQHTFAEESLYKGELVARDTGLRSNAASVNVAARGCGSCDGGDLLGGGLLGGGLTDLLDELLDTVGGLLESVGKLIKDLIKLDGNCEIPVGHEHGGNSHGILDIGDLDLLDLGNTIGKLLEELLGSNNGLLDNIVGGLLRELLGLVEKLLKCLGLDIELTDILDGKDFVGGKSCDPTSLDLNLVQSILKLVQRLLKIVQGLTGDSKTQGLLCKLLETIGNLLNELLGHTDIDGLGDIGDLGITKRSIRRRV